jgi:cytoskeletal protein RodZ
MDSDKLDSGTDAPELPLSGPGDRLRAAREALRLELVHVAAETRIPLRHLEAIEANNFESLPSRTYAIGFSRTFAKAVGLDAAEITDAVRAELADGSMQRNIPSATMEPGDPARLPSRGLAWAGLAAVLVLGVGVVAFSATIFGAGSVPGSLLTPEPAATATAAAAPVPAPAAAPSGPVVLTAREDGVWVRLYEEGGERLAERTLKLGETIEVPATARDPRLTTGRPDALAVTIGGRAVAALSDKPQTLSGLPISAAALNARVTTGATPVPGATPGATVPATPGAAQSAPQAARPAARRSRGAAAPANPAAAEAAPAAQPEAPPAAAPAEQPAAPAGR